MLEKKIIDTVEKLRLASQNIPKAWDGRRAVLEMKNANYRHWRRREWQEFHFKFLCASHLDHIVDMPGKKYSNTVFDAFQEISWDFKVDSIYAETYSVTANDAEAIADTISNYGYYGIILAIGDMERDDEEASFKKWHDELRERTSNYETNRINSGIMSRTRKTAFVLEKIHFICFDSETLHQCCGLFQDRFGETDKNKPKRKEVRVDIGEIPNVAFASTENF